MNSTIAASILQLPRIPRTSTSSCSAFCTTLPVPRTESSRKKASPLHRRRRNSYGNVSMANLGPRLDKVVPKEKSDVAVKSDALVAWLESNGMYLSKVSTWGKPPHPMVIANETTDDGEPSGRGLVATKAVLQGETLFEVPVECIITKERALQEIEDLPESTDDYIAIATYLIHERGKGEKSFWKPYIDILPTDDEMAPLFRWSEDELKLLEGSPTVAAAQSLRAKLAREFQSINDNFFARDRSRFPEDVFSLDAWEWAFAILFSRAIMLSTEKIIALVPYADLLNHNPFCSTYIDMDKKMLTEEKFVSLYTDRPYGKMDQVFVTYGPKSNSELLLLYGFVVDRNPYDSVEITVALDDNDPLLEEKKEYLQSSGVSSATAFPLYRDRYPKELVEFLRFCVSDEEEYRNADFGEFVSSSNETLVAQAIVSACNEALNAYPQAVEEDDALFANKPLYRLLEQKQRWAIRQRIAEKKILLRTIANIESEMAESSFSLNW